MHHIVISEMCRSIHQTVHEDTFQGMHQCITKYIGWDHQTHFIRTSQCWDYNHASGHTLITSWAQEDILLPWQDIPEVKCTAGRFQFCKSVFTNPKCLLLSLSSCYTFLRSSSNPISNYNCKQLQFELWFFFFLNYCGFSFQIVIFLLY